MTPEFYISERLLADHWDSVFVFEQLSHAGYKEFSVHTVDCGITDERSISMFCAIGMDKGMVRSLLVPFFARVHVYTSDNLTESSWCYEDDSHICVNTVSKKILLKGSRPRDYGERDIKYIGDWTLTLL